MLVLTEADPGSVAAPPRIFLSYAWESGYREWVAQLATQLRSDGIDSRLDKWHMRDGQTFPSFMNAEIRAADKVLILGSPLYRQKVHAFEDGSASTGSGWESMLVTGQIFAGHHDKIVVAVAKGAPEMALPDFLWTYPRFNLSNPDDRSEYDQLVLQLKGLRPVAPPVVHPSAIGRVPHIKTGELSRTVTVHLEPSKFVAATASMDVPNAPVAVRPPTVGLARVASSGDRLIMKFVILLALAAPLLSAWLVRPRYISFGPMAFPFGIFILANTILVSFYIGFKTGKLYGAVLFPAMYNFWTIWIYYGSGVYWLPAPEPHRSMGGPLWSVLAQTFSDVFTFDPATYMAPKGFDPTTASDTGLWYMLALSFASLFFALVGRAQHVDSTNRLDGRA